MSEETGLAVSWNYEKSIAKMRPLVLKWVGITIDFLRELHTAREELSKRTGRPKKDGTSVPTYSWDGYCDDIGMEKRTANRWLKNYDPEKHAIIEGTAVHVSHNSGDNEWYTPPEYVDAARSTLGTIDLDPASSEDANAVVKAKKYFTAENDGLSKKWKGKVYMNPPYAQPLVRLFCEKIAEHFIAGEITDAIILVNNATETDWWQGIAKYATAICFPDGRVKFWHPRKESIPLQGQTVLYIGKDAKSFMQNFKGFGVCRILSEI